MSYPTDLSPDGRKALEVLRAARRQLAYYKQLADEARAEIEAERLVMTTVYDFEALSIDGEPVVTYKQIKSHRLDTAALKKALPDVVAHYSKTTESRRFVVIEGADQ